MQLPMIGTTEKTETSVFQITLVDRTNKTLHPMKYPRTSRFFDSKEDRDTFVSLLEYAILQSGGRLVQNPLSHPLFLSFDIVDKDGHTNFEVTIYR